MEPEMRNKVDFFDVGKENFNDLFRAPSNIYRGAPFWAWNGALDRDELLRQIDIFHEMGIGGFHIHSRTGLETVYLEAEFMDLVKKCRDYANSKNMLTWLYDEDRWPSGFAGGLVTKNMNYRMRQLLFTPTPYGQSKQGPKDWWVASRSENGSLMARYAIELCQGKLASYRRLNENESVGAKECLWLAYLETPNSSEWFNGQTYVDTLNPEAIKAFIDITHEKYNSSVGDGFGKSIPAIFTDEPQFRHKTPLRFSEGHEDLIYPWTPDLVADFLQKFNRSILEVLPEVIWDLLDGSTSIWRYRYHEWLAERFVVSFADQVGQWCQRHNIALTGHVMEEPTLYSQCNALGEAMRSYRSFDIPGVDMLCNKMELNTVKQAQSAARQYGRVGVLSELYGVTGWDFDFKGHKFQGDWQAALGVVFRVHHLTWYGMKGEAKRDYPASIGYQSPWYSKYRHIEDHFARVGVALTRGKPICRVAVIHPIESYWLCAGPMDTSGLERDLREEHFKDLTQWLLFGGIDFDFVAESLLTDIGRSLTEAKFGVGEMLYDVVLVPGLLTLRSSTLSQLEAFGDRGGQICFVGEIPKLVDGGLSERALALAQKSAKVEFSKGRIMDYLRPYRDLEWVRVTGKPTATLLYQLREDSEFRTLFICNTSQEEYLGEERFSLRLKGEWKVSLLDTADGHSTSVLAHYVEGETVIKARLYPSGHLLFQLCSGREVGVLNLDPDHKPEVGRILGPCSVSLSEPNVLLLEKAEYRIDNSPWQAEEQLLNIENCIRAHLGLNLQDGNVAQPWTMPNEQETLASVELKMIVRTDIAVAKPLLALENLNDCEVRWNGNVVSIEAVGYFTDKAIATIQLPAMEIGDHYLEIKLNYRRNSAVEWFYLLGDFGVVLRGHRAVITAPVRELHFGDWTSQGLPFYGGHVTYHCANQGFAGSQLQVPQFSGAGVEVSTDSEVKFLYRSPYMVDINLQKNQALDLTVLGHRYNCFGPIHCSDPNLEWKGPNSYRTTGPQFSPEYKLRPMGLLSAPIVRY